MENMTRIHMITPPWLALLGIILTISPAWAGNATWQDIYPVIAKSTYLGSGNRAEPPKSGPVIVAFFASWCPPCTDEFNHLNDLSEGGKLGGAKILAINQFEDFFGRKNPQRMKRFLQKTQPLFPLIHGSEEIRKAFGNVTRIPTVVVFGKSGKEVWRFVHKKDAQKTHTTKQDLVHALELAHR